MYNTLTRASNQFGYLAMYKSQHKGDGRTICIIAMTNLDLQILPNVSQFCPEVLSFQVVSGFRYNL